MGQFEKRAVVELLKTFGKRELREFTTHLNNRGGKSIVALWGAIRYSHPCYQLGDNDIYQEIRPGERFNDKVYRVWVAKLTRLAKEYIAISDFLENTLQYNNTLAMGLLKRRVKKMGQKTLMANEKHLEKMDGLDSHFYTYRYQHEDISYQYVTLLDHRKTTDSLQKAVDFLDYSFIVQKLKFLVAMHNRRRIVLEGYVFKMEEQILAYLDANIHEDMPLIHLYYLTLRFMRDLNDHQIFHQFMAYYKTNYTKIDPVEARQLCTAALNFCLWNIRKGHQEFLAYRWELAENMIAEELLLVEGKIPGYHFENIVRISIEAGAFTEAEEFINNWLPRTDPASRKELESFNRAYLHFAKNEYEKQNQWMKVMEGQDYAFLDINTEIAFRILKLKTGFQHLPKPKDLIKKQQSMADQAFQAQLEAFRLFLSRKEFLPDNFRASAKNFHKALHQLHQIKQGKALRVGDLRSYIFSLGPIRELPWLLHSMKQSLSWRDRESDRL